MPEKITYFAMVDDLSSRDEPAGVLRRIEDDEGQQDEAFTRNLEWEYSWSLYSYERGNRDVEFHEISEVEANRIVERIRRTVADALQACGLGPVLPSRMTLGSGIARARNGLVDHTRSAAQDPSSSRKSLLPRQVSPSSRKSLPPRASPSLHSRSGHFAYLSDTFSTLHTSRAF
jgi:hypothetical protein